MAADCPLPPSNSSKRQRTFHTYHDGYDYQEENYQEWTGGGWEQYHVCDSITAPIDSTLSTITDVQLSMYTVDRGYGIFDTGATGHAISNTNLTNSEKMIQILLETLIMTRSRLLDTEAVPRQQVLEYVPKLSKQDL